MTRPLSNLSSRCGNRSGFTLVEILVVIAIIALLAGVALPAITGALLKARENGAVQTAHGLGLAEFQFATDNNGNYPTGTTSSILFKSMFPTYLNSLDALFVSGGAATSKWNGTAVVGPLNNAWDAVVRSATVGLTTNDPDPLPAVMTTAYTLTIPSTVGTSAAVTAANPPTTPANAPFAANGLAVGYKDLSSAFITASSNQSGSANTSVFNVTSASFQPVTSYIQVMP